MNATTQTIFSDELLISQIRAGDQAAFLSLMDRYRDRIFSRVFHLLKNREDAEEVTQDAFIRAHRGLENFRGDASFSTWLYQIATNLAHNRYWYWSRRKRQQSFSLEQPIQEGETLTLEDLIPSTAADPSEEYLQNEWEAKIAEALPQLNTKHRQILEMRIRQHLSYEEIAQTLKISVGTVKSRIARARESLRQKLGTDFE
jgi:RNA polymerase sigma-70 factor (ECF subfamily)